MSLSSNWLFSVSEVASKASSEADLTGLKASWLGLHSDGGSVKNWLPLILIVIRPILSSTPSEWAGKADSETRVKLTVAEHFVFAVALVWQMRSCCYSCGVTCYAREVSQLPLLVIAKRTSDHKSLLAHFTIRKIYPPTPHPTFFFLTTVWLFTTMTKILPKIDFFTINCSSFKGATEIDKKTGFVVPVGTSYLPWFFLCCYTPLKLLMHLSVCSRAGVRRRWMENNSGRPSCPSRQLLSHARWVPASCSTH